MKRSILTYWYFSNHHCINSTLKQQQIITTNNEGLQQQTTTNNNNNTKSFNKKYDKNNGNDNNNSNNNNNYNNYNNYDNNNSNINETALMSKLASKSVSAPTLATSTTTTSATSATSALISASTSALGEHRSTKDSQSILDIFGTNTDFRTTKRPGFDMEVKFAESTQSYSASVLIATRKGKERVVLCYRRVNKQAKEFAYPMPNGEGLLKANKNCRYFSVVDAKSGFRLPRLKEEHHWFTAFTLSIRAVFSNNNINSNINSSNIGNSNRSNISNIGMSNNNNSGSISASTLAPINWITTKSILVETITATVAQQQQNQHSFNNNINSNNLI
ncbi:hypothetical protein ACTA71_008402 [Dictyostelium dimigraforme]